MTVAVIALAIALAAAVPTGIAGWVTAYRQRGKTADADLDAQAAAAALDGEIDARTAIEADRDRLKGDLAARDAEVTNLRDELRAFDALLTQLPASPETSKLVIGRLERFGILPPVEGSES